MKFLDCIHPFGFRRNNDDEVWEGCHKYYKREQEESQRLLECGIATASRGLNPVCH